MTNHFVIVPNTIKIGLITKFNILAISSSLEGDNVSCISDSVALEILAFAVEFSVTIESNMSAITPCGDD